MGFSKKSQADSGFGLEGKKWVIAGISLQPSLKPVITKPSGKQSVGASDKNIEEGYTTPTAKESRIPERLPCPQAPRKRRPSTCHYNGVREFFTPPDLDTVFKCYVEKAN